MLCQHRGRLKNRVSLTVYHPRGIIRKVLIRLKQGVLTVKKLLSLILCLIFTLALTGCVNAEEITVPELTLAPQTIPENDALAFTRQMKVGWNLGNTFDSSDCNWLTNKLDYETAWGNPKTTEKVIDAIQAAGFNTIRIPVSWHNHVNADFVIDTAWLDRVNTVVDWAYDRGMYVIINIHHDCAPGYYYPSEAEMETSEKYMRTIWEQLAGRFAEYDEHLIFESVNEPRLAGTAYEWTWSAGIPECQEAMSCICRLNQIFVDTVRATGGNNAERYLMVPSYAANPGYALYGDFSLPEDTADNKIILSVHAYTPYNFALQMPGTSEFSLDNAGMKGEIANFMRSLQLKYINNGIPVVIGEFGAMTKGNNLQDRVDWAAWYVDSAAIRGIPCVWWDNGAFTGSGELFGIIDRRTCQWKYEPIVNAIMKYAMQ